jgi:hypothetical protein
MGTIQRTKPNGFLPLAPSDAEIRIWHQRRSQRRIWGQELAPSRPQPRPTGCTDGIQKGEFNDGRRSARKGGKELNDEGEL